jgi:hypothetical protein
LANVFLYVINGWLFLSSVAQTYCPRKGFLSQISKTWKFLKHPSYACDGSSSCQGKKGLLDFVCSICTLSRQAWAIADSSNCSVNAFIPLSKCHQIRLINLNLISESILFDDVLRPFRNLQHLLHLSFPRNTVFRNLPDGKKVRWPPNIEVVTLSGVISKRQPYSWEHFARDWPSTLQSILVDNLCDLKVFCDDSGDDSRVPHNLKTLYLTDRNCLWYNRDMVLRFSRVRFLSLPANLTMSTYRSCLPGAVLEQLEVRRKCTDEPDYFQLSDLLEHARAIPTLRQIRLHETLMEDGNTCLQSAGALIKSRAEAEKKGVGTTMVRQEDAGIVVFDL